PYLPPWVLHLTGPFRERGNRSRGPRYCRPDRESRPHRIPARQPGSSLVPFSPFWINWYQRKESYTQGIGFSLRACSDGAAGIDNRCVYHYPDFGSNGPSGRDAARNGGRVKTVPGPDTWARRGAMGLVDKQVDEPAGRHR